MIVVVVDGYSTGRYLPAALAATRVGCVHVRSTLTVPTIYAADHDPSVYLADLLYESNLRALTEQVAAHSPALVMAGTESGVTLAEDLAAELELARNGARLRGVRRDKFLMSEAVAKAGLAVPDTAVCATVKELTTWVDTHNTWPIVVKPIDSAGTDNVYICENLSSLLLAFNRTRRSHNLFGKANETVLIQEFLHGEEYFVNTVTKDCRHYVAEVWRYHKITVPGRGRIYDYEEPVPPDSLIAEQLGDYVSAVLSALDIQYGPAHTEVMWTTTGPVLIECGARLAGSVLPDAVRRCFGTSQLDLTAMLIGDPEAFTAITKARYRLNGTLRYVCLVARMNGTVANEANDLIDTLPSFAGTSRPLDSGSPVCRTVDSLTSPGAVYLYHPDAAVVERDYTTLRQWEHDRLYVSAEDCPKSAERNNR